MKIIEFIQKQELDQKKILLLTITTVLIVIIDVVFLLSLQHRMIQRSAAKVKQLRSAIRSVNQDLTKMKQENAESRVKPKTKKLVAGDQISSLLEGIYTNAKRNKVYIALMQPVRESQDVKQTAQAKAKAAPRGSAAKVTAPVKHTASKAKAAAPAPRKPQPAVECGTVQFTMELVGEYHAIGAFLFDLENAEECVAVDSLRIFPDSNNELQQKANILLKIYVKI